MPPTSNPKQRATTGDKAAEVNELEQKDHTQEDKHINEQDEPMPQIKPINSIAS